MSNTPPILPLSDESCTQELEKRLEEVKESRVEMIDKTLEELESLKNI